MEIAENETGSLGAMIGKATTFAIALSTALLISGCGNLSDGFEQRRLSKHVWTERQIKPYRHWTVRNPVRSGKQALAIEVKPLDRACYANVSGTPVSKCQRQEIRVHPRHWTRFGDEQWYRFSFRIGGTVGRRGGQHWVIAQWKRQRSGLSPFLAQRYSNGVFHITVQDHKCRRVVASAKGDPRAKAGSFESFAKSDFGISHLAAYPFVSERKSYKCTPDIRIERGPGYVLPDPYRNWVDMLYRVKGGMNGTGEVDVWANGKLVVKVRGSIGVREAGGPKQYFKIGMYRARRPYTTLIYIDNFARGPTRKSVTRAFR